MEGWVVVRTHFMFTSQNAQHSYKKGVKTLGESAREGAYNGADDMYQRDDIKPIHMKA